MTDIIKYWSDGEVSCLHPPRGLNSAPANGIGAIHPHQDSSWWFWDETWTREYGPYATEALAASACEDYARQL